MLSDPQEIGLAALLFTAFSYAPLLVASSNKYAAHKAKAKYQKEFAQTSAGSLGYFTILGFVMYGLLAAAATAYFWTGNPATSSIDATLYTWTLGVYILFIASKTLVMVHVVYGVDKRTACLKAWFAFGAAVFLLASTAYSVGNWEGDRFADVVFAMVVFAVNALWSGCVLYHTHLHAHAYAKMRQHADAAAYVMHAPAPAPRPECSYSG